MIKSSNGDTPFSLTYGTEAVIPAEIGMPTFRTAEVDVAKNDEALEINLELLEEKREQAAIREAKSKRQMEKYYNTKVRNASFKPGDLVYRSNEASRVEDTGKLGPKWEGPYEVTEALGKGSYKLKDRNGRELPRTWNICNLKKSGVRLSTGQPPTGGVAWLGGVGHVSAARLTTLALPNTSMLCLHSTATRAADGAFIRKYFVIREPRLLTGGIEQGRTAQQWWRWLQRHIPTVLVMAVAWVLTDQVVVPKGFGGSRGVAGADNCSGCNDSLWWFQPLLCQKGAKEIIERICAC
ncbi:hypothetical protein Tco_0007243 [Tanacetum coccineum]